MKLNNKSGLEFEFHSNGGIKRISSNNIRIGLRDANPFSIFGTSIFLRERSEPKKYIMLIGTGTNSVFAFENNCFFAKGKWNGIDYLVSLQLHSNESNWLWSIELINSNSSPNQYDIILVQDVGLKQLSNGPINEYYVSQYIERLILNDPQFGAVVCCRQNMRESNGNPWLIAACSTGAASATTDGLNVYGSSYRKTKIPIALEFDSLPGECAAESSVIAIQSKPFSFNTSNNKQIISFGFKFMADHPAATSYDDLAILPKLFGQFDFKYPTTSKWEKGTQNLFTNSEFFPSHDLNEAEINQLYEGEKRFPEFNNGKLLSFFFDKNRHVVLGEKDILTYRPHGHIIQSNINLKQNDNIVSLTTWSFGVFNSHLKQGNTNFNTLLSINTSQFNLLPETGQRIFIELNNKYYQLGIPSAYEMGLNYARWIYKYENNIFQVTTWASTYKPKVNFDFKVLSGNPVNIIVSNNLDELNGWQVNLFNNSFPISFKPSPESLLSKNYPKAQYHLIVNKTDYSDLEIDNGKCINIDSNYANSFIVIKSAKTKHLSLSFICELEDAYDWSSISDPEKEFQSDINDALSFRKGSGLEINFTGNSDKIKIINEIIPWFESNALVHYLTPYGLEQFGGAAWGTRDVSQGPIELLLSLGKYDVVKEIIYTIFSNQNTDGWWPQWWMFDKYKNIRAHEAHGDIAYWCIIALSNYILASGDFEILNTPLPYFSEESDVKAEITPLMEHVERLISRIIKSFIPGTALVPFGGGDWNDSLQPVNSDLAQRLVSSWTVEMNYHAFKLFENVYKLIGLTEKSNGLCETSNKIKADFNKYLVKDGIVAGYGLLENNGAFSLLLHPSDSKTGVRYSILPMNRGVLSGIFNPNQAEHHQQLIYKNLIGPDGARLMDKPLKYSGGLQKIFQRAESSTFFGREIGLMYMHEHIRFAESLAITGKADEFIHALLQAIPINYHNIVRQGDIRQANCYYSSSDVLFKNRYEADKYYPEVIKGNFTLHGGWRVYSSGPGIFIGILMTRLLGFRFNNEFVTIDPVLPKELNGLVVNFTFNSFPIKVTYHVTKSLFSPYLIKINNFEPSFTYEENPYRKGGIRVERKMFFDLLNSNENNIEIFL
ncbi:MAG: hypothetical protein AB1777_11330 [Bacteroidota bacterium]